MAIKPKPFNRTILGVADDFGEALVDDLKFQIANKDKFATGNLADTMYHEAKSANGKAVVMVFAADYFRFVEKGRKPNSKMPPDQPIRKWVRVRGVTSRDGQFISENSKVFLIRRSIARKGIKGIFIINPTINKITEEFIPKYSKQLANLVGVTLVNDIFSETNTKGRIIPKSLRK